MEYTNNLNQYLFSTALQKILNILAANMDREFTEKEISQTTEVKKSAVNLALRKLVEENMIAKKQFGRTALYQAKPENYLIKEIKILQNILTVAPLIEKLKPVSQKIILFGSSAKGENTGASDFDLFAQSNRPQTVRQIINSSPLRGRLQLVVKTAREMLSINNKQKPLFYQEIEKGRVLWENYGQ